MGKIREFFYLLAIAVLISLSMIFIGAAFREEYPLWKNQKILEDLQSDVKAEETGDEDPGIDWEKLKKINPDIVGWIKVPGTLLDPDECRRMNPYSPWIRYLHEAEEYNMAFYFTEGEHPVYISQKDIRQIQMAKSSICSGCLALLEEAGLTLESIDYLVLAGAFGNYIDIDNALSIGLLPPVSREKIISIGNGAGQGVQSFLLDQSYRVRAKNIANNCIHVSLAENKKFMESYIKNMNFSVDKSL